MSTFKYDIGDEDYPEYAKKTAFEVPSGGEDYTVIARRTHQGGKKELKGWLLRYIGDDPDSDWTLFEGRYCVKYPWDYNPDEDPANGVPDAANDAHQVAWTEPTGSVKRYMNQVFVLLVDDERIVRTLDRYRQ